MNAIFIKYFIFLISSFLITILSIPNVIKIGIKKGFIDKPNKRKKHNKNIVRIGGLSIALGFFITNLMAIYFGIFEVEALNKVYIIIISSFCFFNLGFVEDIFRISMISRLAFQILFSCLVWGAGFQIKMIDLSLLITDSSLIVFPNIVSLFITVIWIVGITNSFNWIDGLDGLSSGLAAISVLSFSILLLLINDASISMLMASILGSCLGFLYFNFYPAKIFMGDGGSYLIGFLISLFAIYLHNAFLSVGFKQISFFWQCLVLFVPIVDMAYVFFSRIIEGKSPFYPDRRHLHYRLQRLGFGHLESVILCYLFTINSSLLALISAFEEYNVYFLVCIFLIVSVYTYLRYQKIIFAFKKLYEKLK